MKLFELLAALVQLVLEPQVVVLELMIDLDGFLAKAINWQDQELEVRHWHQVLEGLEQDQLGPLMTSTKIQVSHGLDILGLDGEDQLHGLGVIKGRVVGVTVIAGQTHVQGLQVGEAFEHLQDAAKLFAQVDVSNPEHLK